MFIKDEALQIEDYVHGFFTRNGGVSQGTFNSLNCCFNNAEPKDITLENRQIVAKAMGFELSQLQTAKQIHSDIVVTINEENLGKYIEADALVTYTPGILLGIQTADCCPIIFADNDKNIIAAAHAGWRGAFAGILQNTIKTMVSLGSKPKDIIAVIGPSIAQKSYEVDQNFKDNFIAQNPQNLRYFIDGTTIEKYLFDLKQYCRDTLKTAGIGQVHKMDIDTYSDKESFYSFRRSTHEGLPKTGFGMGHLSVIGLPKHA